MNLTFHHASVAQLVEHRAAMGGGGGGSEFDLSRTNTH